MPRIDVGLVLREKAPRLARWIPRLLVNRLRRLIHEEELNHIFDAYWQLAPQPFIRACFREWQVGYSIEGLERLDPAGRYLFVANHPFGGMDGMMLADKLIEHFGDVRVVVNDILRHVSPLESLWVPVNKHGAQTAAYALRFNEAFAGPLPVLTFPAGLCSRKIDGRVTDTEWRPGFLKRAAASNRQIVPIFVEGRLSNFFYRLSRLRKALGIKVNIEMLWLPDEMFSQQGRHFRMRVGRPIDPAELAAFGSVRERIEEVRRRCYALEKELSACGGSEEKA